MTDNDSLDERPYEVRLIRREPFVVIYEVFARSHGTAAKKARATAQDTAASHPDGEEKERWDFAYICIAMAPYLIYCSIIAGVLHGFGTIRQFIALRTAYIFTYNFMNTWFY